MKEYEEISGNKIFTNDEIKKLQEEENENIKKKKDFLNYRLYSIKKRQEKRIKVKDMQNLNYRKRIILNMIM